MTKSSVLISTSLMLLIMGCGNAPPVSPVSSSVTKTVADNRPMWGPLTSNISIDATKTVSTRIIADDQNSVLSLRKHGKQLEILLVPIEPFGTPVFVGSESGRVRWKIDTNTLHTEEWNGSEDGTALFSSRPYVLLQVLEHVGSGHTLQVEYKPYENQPRVITFILPSTVPDEFKGIADSIVAAQQKEAAAEQKAASIREQYESCMADNSKRRADCIKILNENGYSYPPQWK
jgi:hypothetical protein